MKMNGKIDWKKAERFGLIKNKNSRGGKWRCYMLWNVLINNNYVI